MHLACVQSLGSSKLPSPEQLHIPGGAAALTTSLLVSVGYDGCVCVAALEENNLLGLVGGWNKRGSSSSSKAQEVW